MEIRKQESLFAFILLCMPQNVYASTNINHIFDDTFASRVDFYTDTIIHDGVRVMPKNINVSDGIQIDNRGYISGNINVCSDCVLFIKNSGTINANINLATGASITQVITNATEITDIGLSKDFDIWVRDGTDISFDDLMAMGVNASKITFDNVVLYTDSRPHNQNQPTQAIELIGETSVFLGSLDDVLNGNVFLSNVRGDGVINFYSDDIDKIHALKGFVTDGDLYIKLVRETDYVKIFHNDVGKFLNNLRTLSPDDPLLMAMDSVPDIDSMYSVMSRSVRLHPINLMRPIRTHMSMRDISIEPRDNEFGIGSRVMFSSDYYMYGIDGGVGFHVSGNWRVVSTFGVGYISYMDDINSFMATVYDGRIGIGYDNGRIIHRANISAAISKFDVGPVFDNREIVYNPTGFLLHTMYEAGRRFDVLRSVKFIPVIGANMDLAHVASENDYSIAGVAGFDTEFNGGYFIMDYDYILRARANTNRDMSAMIGVRMTAHDFGADISFGILRDEFTTSFNASVGLRIAF